MHKDAGRYSYVFSVSGPDIVPVKGGVFCPLKGLHGMEIAYAVSYL